MNYHQSNVFLLDLSNSFHHWLNLSNFSFRSASIIHGGVSRHHSQHLKTEEEFFLHILSVLSEICHSSLLPSSHSCFWIVRILFTYPEQFKILFSLFLWSPSSQNLFILSFQLSFSKSYRCIIPVLSNQFMISLFSYI